MLSTDYILFPTRRYELLLADMLRMADTSTDEYTELHQASELVKKVAHHMNEMIKIAENQEKIREIESQFTTPPGFFAPSRYFIRHSTLSKVCRKRQISYEFFLFSDMIAYASKSRKSLIGSPLKDGTSTWVYKLHRCMKIDSSFSFRDLTHEDELSAGSSYELGFALMSRSKSFFVLATDTATKQAWATDLARCVERWKCGEESRKVTFENSSHRSAPVWRPDKTAESCPNCQTKFSVFVRRHHCRVCGNLACAQCSRGRLALDPNRSAALERVCDPCMEVAGVHLNNGSNKENLGPKSSPVTIPRTKGSFSSFFGLDSARSFSRFFAAADKADPQSPSMQHLSESDDESLLSCPAQTDASVEAGEVLADHKGGQLQCNSSVDNYVPVLPSRDTAPRLLADELQASSEPPCKDLGRDIGGSNLEQIDDAVLASSDERAPILFVDVEGACSEAAATLPIPDNRTPAESDPKWGAQLRLPAGHSCRLSTEDWPPLGCEGSSCPRKAANLSPDPPSNHLSSSPPTPETHMGSCSQVEENNFDSDLTRKPPRKRSPSPQAVCHSSAAPTAVSSGPVDPVGADTSETSLLPPLAENTKDGTIASADCLPCETNSATSIVQVSHERSNRSPSRNTIKREKLLAGLVATPSRNQDRADALSPYPASDSSPISPQAMHAFQTPAMVTYIRKKVSPPRLAGPPKRPPKRPAAKIACPAQLPTRISYSFAEPYNINDPPKSVQKQDPSLHRHLPPSSIICLDYFEDENARKTIEKRQAALRLTVPTPLPRSPVILQEGASCGDHPLSPTRLDMVVDPCDGFDLVAEPLQDGKLLSSSLASHGRVAAAGGNLVSGDLGGEQCREEQGTRTAGGQDAGQGEPACVDKCVMSSDEHSSSIRGTLNSLSCEQLPSSADCSSVCSVPLPAVADEKNSDSTEELRTEQGTKTAENCGNEEPMSGEKATFIPSQGRASLCDEEWPLLEAAATGGGHKWRSNSVAGKKKKKRKKRRKKVNKKYRKLTAKSEESKSKQLPPVYQANEVEMHGIDSCNQRKSSVTGQPDNPECEHKAKEVLPSSLAHEQASQDMCCSSIFATSQEEIKVEVPQMEEVDAENVAASELQLELSVNDMHHKVLAPSSPIQSVLTATLQTAIQQGPSPLAEAAQAAKQCRVIFDKAFNFLCQAADPAPAIGSPSSDKSGEGLASLHCADEAGGSALFTVPLSESIRGPANSAKGSNECKSKKYCLDIFDENYSYMP